MNSGLVVAGLHIANADGLGGLDPQCDLHAVNAIDSWIARRGAPQSGHVSVWNKTHVHQVVLNRLGQIEGNQYPALADPQLAQNAQPQNPQRPQKGEHPLNYDQNGLI